MINLSVGEGWVSDYATRNLLLPLDGVPQEVKDGYFEGLWKSQNVAGKNYQFPFYQGVSVELINKRFFEAAGLDPAAFPKSVEELPALCKTLKEKASVVCDLRLTVNDLLAQMVYEGNVKVLSDDGSASRSIRPRASRGCRCTRTWSRTARRQRRADHQGRPHRPADLLGRPGAVLSDRPEPHP